MKRKITATIYTLLFIVEQLLLPKATIIYSEWLGVEDVYDLPLLLFTIGFVWMGQIALAIYLWARVWVADLQ